MTATIPHIGGGVNPARGPAAFDQRLGEFVGMVLYGPVLRKMNESPFKTRFSSGGRGEAVFAAQLALELSQKLGRTTAQQVCAGLSAAARRMYATGDRA